MNSENQIFVFATTQDGTSASLRHAAALVGKTGARVVILVAHVVDHGSPLNGAITPADVEALSAPYRALAARIGLDVHVRCASAREAKHLPGRLLLVRAHIIVGGLQRGWRATAEQQLARDLTCEGHRVTFIDVKSGQPTGVGVAVPA
ncbi:MAG TPA: hypothetical protein VHZ73_10110 [Vicinamibacterales bacterium]|nr:hypothetical protein [Vicinamibacterales bacterium]